MTCRTAGGQRRWATTRARGGNWTRADLDACLAAPRGFLPGTSMTFAGIASGETRARIIEYLESLSC